MSNPDPNQKTAFSRAAWASLLNGLALMALLGLVWHDQISLMPIFPYPWHKLLHLLGVVMFAGNLIVGPIWVIVAFYSQDIHLLKYALKLLVITDLVLTLPGLDLTVLNGLWMASALGGLPAQPWLALTAKLLVAMWLLSLPVLVIQEKLSHVVQHSDSMNAEIKTRFYQWGLWGSLVSLPPLLIFGLMVLKHF